MNPEFKIPPDTPNNLTKPKNLCIALQSLIGARYALSGKTRTDGSNLRKLVAKTLEAGHLPPPAKNDLYEVVPPKGKGVPKITREFVDTYIVTSGDSYNLQVWNRSPASDTLLIKYENGESLKCTDVRFVMVRIDIRKGIISAIIILTPEYIETRFGRFGKPTIKQQLLISRKVRKEIYESVDKIKSFPDTKKLSYYITHDYVRPNSQMVEEPDLKRLYSIELLRKMVAERLIGKKLDSGPTKNRGQALERAVLQLLGYEIKETDLLYGAFPDIKNQLLEVKVQDSPTVDLGRFSPEKEEVLFHEKGLTTFDVRYLIALTNSNTEIIEGIILSPGECLGELFSYVSSESYKCQRAIPMAFFDKYEGSCVFNPD